MAEKEMTPKEIEQLRLESADEYLNAAIYLTALDPNIKELNFIKTAVEMPDGGIYLLSLLHVSGPKIQMDEMRAKMQPMSEGDIK